MFDSIRFDKENFSFSVKSDIAEAVLKNFENEKNKGLKKLAAIQELCKILLAFNVELPLTDWARRHRFGILSNAVMTDTDFRDELSLLE